MNSSAGGDIPMGELRGSHIRRILNILNDVIRDHFAALENSFMPSDIPTVELTQAQIDLLRLHRQIARTKGRVQIHGPDGDGDCVLISQEELMRLEEAIEMLSDNGRVQSMCQCLSALLADEQQEQEQRQ